MDDFQRILPREITESATRIGNELVIQFAECHRAIILADQSLISILGIEAFRILRDGSIHVETYSGYEFCFDGDWKTFVGVNNEAALRFLVENRFDEGYGYILTGTSKHEFDSLARQFNSSDS
jgi:hypothetical protein